MNDTIQKTAITELQMSEYFATVEEQMLTYKAFTKGVKDYSMEVRLLYR